MGGPGPEAPEEAALLLIDDDGRAIAATDAALDLLRISRDAVPGWSVSALFGVPDGAPGDWRLAVAAAGGEGVLRNGIAAWGRRSLEYVIRLDVVAGVHLVLVRPGGRTS